MHQEQTELSKLVEEISEADAEKRNVPNRAERRAAGFTLGLYRKPRTGARSKTGSSYHWLPKAQAARAAEKAAAAAAAEASE